jgi:Mn2+/Fe2+ NRAMP family transporter
VVAVPLMVMMMLMTARRAVMGAFTLPPALAVLGWLSTLTMAATVAAMVVTW